MSNLSANLLATRLGKENSRMTGEALPTAIFDAFKVRRDLIHDYRTFTEGFVEIRDKRLADSVREQADQGAQWPDPWISLNPSFAIGGSVDELAESGLLTRQTADLFRLPGADVPLSLYEHQVEAIQAARQGASYVLTTGTGSGKSLAYIIPIVDFVLRHPERTGIKAIIVYPMNALANSQREELAKFLGNASQGEVTYARYTGQEQDEERERILADPPDILLTNYVMLELLLTRPNERRKLIGAASGLQFLVLDELHTYRGRQGADVAMLVRRVRQATHSGGGLQCVGTSATMSTADTVAEQKIEVAGVASQVFGTTVQPENVIAETLIRATEGDPNPASLGNFVDARGSVEADDARLSAGYDRLRADPLAAWVERQFGLATEPGSGILIRRNPTTVKKAGELLAEHTGRTIEACQMAIQQTLLAGARTINARTGQPLFAFRLHQFISKGSSVYVTLENEDTRAIEHEYQVVLPGPAGAKNEERRLYPLAFCRDCGQEYLMVHRDETNHVFTARTRMNIGEADGYLYISSDKPWPSDPIDGVPDTWTETAPSGRSTIIRSRRDRVPQTVYVTPMGDILEPDMIADVPKATEAAWIPKGLLFCLRCETTYHQARQLEASKVVALDQEGRSSAMTVLSLSIIRSLESSNLDPSVKKLLTFVDNRQDASLQAGHVNDFVLVGQLRSAVYAAALHSGEDGLDPLEYATVLPQFLNLAPEYYAQNPTSFDMAPAKRAVAQVIEYRALQDLKRGWRITLPNLEQTGLIKVAYPTAEALCRHDDSWADAHSILRDATSADRAEMVTVLLDEFRRVLAIDTDLFSKEHVDRLQRQSREHLTGVWTVEDGEPIPDVGIATLGKPQTGSFRSVFSISRQSLYGRWLYRRYGNQFDAASIEAIEKSLVRILASNGILTTINKRGEFGYALKLHQIRLFPGTGEFGAPDPLRRTSHAETGAKVVEYFKTLYLEAGKELAGVTAKEHTAQVRADDREEREEQFRKGELKLLYCSPTMELGVDIATLDAVAMRNVPPTPANYAQRSGRAGRSGQPALVVTYCANGNAHDSYYFQRSDQMVAGRVLPPRIDLTNEDLLRSHIHAIWLAGTNLSLGRSMADVLSIPTDGDVYPLKQEITQVLDAPDLVERASKAAHDVIDELSDDLSQTSWWHDEWVDDVIKKAPDAFNRACDRWRYLDFIARDEMNVAFSMVGDSSLNPKDRQAAEIRLGEARRQRDLLLNESEDAFNGDFYPYRYFASEGFLPGYSFPRLPIAAYIPGRAGKDQTWLQRPRFLALNEFGPGAFIYHEGARYKVVRVNLPRLNLDNSTGHNTSISLQEVQICSSCGYDHDRKAGIDMCQNCGEPLGNPMSNLLPMRMVITRRRDRIGADEEERQRSGFDITTSYRFASRGAGPSSLHATVFDADGPIVEVQYGDAAEIRRVNRGPKRRAATTSDGFWLDTVRGEWLTDQRAADLDSDDDDSPRADDVAHKTSVIPYVEDRRNIAIMRWAERVDNQLAATLMFAIERSIEALYQLEDSELTTERLPDKGERGRFMLVEAAEGGAGVLRRLQAEPGALAKVAIEALKIIHVDPVTGKDDAAKNPCVRGCYRCLLTYGNQSSHELIDRRSAIPTLLRLAKGVTKPDAVSSPDTSGLVLSPMSIPDNLNDSVESALDYLRENNLKLPTTVGSVVAGIPVDLEYPDEYSVVIFLDSGPRPDVDALTFSGWNVITVEPDDPFERIVRANPSVFGGVER